MIIMMWGALRKILHWTTTFYQKEEETELSSILILGGAVGLCLTLEVYDGELCTPYGAIGPKV